MNARGEFIHHVGDKVVICAIVGARNLKLGFSQEEFETFLSRIDFEYDNGYGGQELYGTIWYDDGSWSERGEYDGSEWWEHKKCPEYPVELLAD